MANSGKTGKGITEGYKTHNVPAGYIKYGIGGKGVELNPEIRRRRVEYSGENGEERELNYFVNHKGLYDEGFLEIRNGVIKRLKSSDGNFYEYPIFLEYQIEHSLKRGDGMITWPDKEGRPRLESISLDILLELNEDKIDKDLIKAGVDDDSIDYILRLIRYFKRDEEMIKEYLKDKYEREERDLFLNKQKVY